MCVFTGNKRYAMNRHGNNSGVIPNTEISLIHTPGFIQIDLGYCCHINTPFGDLVTLLARYKKKILVT